MNETLVQKQFGVAAADYATSAVHASGPSLARLVALVPTQREWSALDVANPSLSADQEPSVRLGRDEDPSSLDQIVQGRPNGMPAFGGMHAGRPQTRGGRGPLGHPVLKNHQGRGGLALPEECFDQSQPGALVGRSLNGGFVGGPRLLGIQPL